VVWLLAVVLDLLIFFDLFFLIFLPFLEVTCSTVEASPRKAVSWVFEDYGIWLICSFLILNQMPTI
jgi:hypothetical protein